jgi:AAA domain
MAPTHGHNIGALEEINCYAITDEELREMLAAASTEEEKQQRRSPATNCVEEHCAALYRPCSGSTYFDDFVKNPSKAVLLYYVNSGLFRFQEYKEYGTQWNGCELDVTALQKEMEDEDLTDKELDRIIKNFLRAHPYTNGRLMSCASCGIRLYEKRTNPPLEYRAFSLLDPLLKPLCYDDEEEKEYKALLDHCSTSITIPIDDKWTNEQINVQQARSVFTLVVSNKRKHFHVHQELVKFNNHGVPKVYICPSCLTSLKAEKKPPLSIAAGVDFGFFERLGLTKPDFQEQMIIARSRLYMAKVKFTSNTTGIIRADDKKEHFKCHAILFPHDAPQTAAYKFNPDLFGEGGLLDVDGMKSVMQVFFMDPDGKIDYMAKKILGQSVFTARPWVVAQWLITLKWLNPYYTDIDVHDLKKIKAAVERIGRGIVDSIVLGASEEVLGYESKLGGDVAEVMHTEVPPSHRREHQTFWNSQPDDDRHNATPISYSLVTNKESAYLMRDKNDFRTQALSRFAELSDDDAHKIASHDDEVRNFIFDKLAVGSYLHKFPPSLLGSSLRDANPLSDWEKSDRILATAFPHAFLLGRAYGKPPGSLSSKERFHLLNQFTLVHAQDRKLLSYLFDVMQRTRVIKGVNQYVDGNWNSIRSLKELFQSSKERELLREATNYPYSEWAKKVLDKYMVHLRFSVRDVPYSSVEGMRLKQNIIACCKRYATPTCFLTISPSNRDNPRSIRLTFRTIDNSSFPADFDPNNPYGSDGFDFLNKFKPQSEGSILLPAAERSRRAVDNPVAFVVENKQLLSDVLTLLIGLSPENVGFFSQYDATARRKTRYFKAFKGIYGHPLFANGVTEGHQKGTLHWHLDFSAGLSPYVLQRFSNLPGLCATISNLLDRWYCSSLPENTHIAYLVREKFEQERFRWDVRNTVNLGEQARSTFACNAQTYYNISTNSLSFTHESLKHYASMQQAPRQNIHRHMPSVCYKGPSGLLGCRVAMPQAMNKVTRPMQLAPKTHNEVMEIDDRESNVDRTFNPLPLSWEDDNNHPSVRLYDIDRCPLVLPPRSTFWYKLIHPVTDKIPSKVIIWETKRPPLYSESFMVADESLRRYPDVSTYIRQVIQNSLCQVPYYGITDNELFYHWLNKEADDTHLIALFKHVRDKLPKANGYVASFNPTISFCTSSHHNAVLLGSSSQSVSALFYLIPYMKKLKFQLAQSLPIIQKTMEDVKKHKSKSKHDSGTLHRTAKHFLARVLNRFGLLMEVSDYQIAAALLDLPSKMETDRFSFADPWTLAYLRKQLQFEHSETEGDNMSQTNSSSSEQGIITRILKEIELRNEQQHQMNWTSNRAMADFFADSDDSSAVISQEGSRSDSETETCSASAGQPGHHDSTNGTTYTRQDSPYEDMNTGTLGMVRKLRINLPQKAEKRNDLPNIIHQDEGNNALGQAETILIPEIFTYYYRGKELWDLSYYEFQACVEFKNLKPPDDLRNNRSNLQSQRIFLPDKNFIGRSDSYYVLRKKQCTPTPVGRCPPHPGNPPSNDSPKSEAFQAKYNRWEAKADAFAKYYLAYFRPDYPGSNLRYSYNDLELWIKQLQNDVSIMSKFRLMMFHRNVLGLRNQTVTNLMTKQHRNRCRDMRSDVEVQKAMHENHVNEQRMHDYLRKLATFDTEIVNPLKESEMTSCKQQLSYDSLQTTAFKALCGTSPCSSRPNQTLRNFRLANDDSRSLDSMYDKMKNWKPSFQDGASKEPNGLPRNLHVKIAKIRREIAGPLSYTRGVQQLNLFDRYVERFLHKPGSDSFPQVVILHGGPGVGKTTVRDAILEVSSLCGNFNLKMSYNSINAVEMGGKTTCYYIGTRNHGEVAKVKAEIIQELKRQGLQPRRGLVVIEEFENMSSSDHAQVSELCKEVTGISDKPYGGLDVLLIGDTSQLGPVRANDATKSVMDVYIESALRKRIASKVKEQLLRDSSVLPPEHFADKKYMCNHPNMLGVQLLTKARLFELNIQQRSIDPLHTELIQSMYRGDKITFENLKNNNYQILDAIDLQQLDWLQAPILTATNRERFSLLHWKAVLFGRHKQLPILRWLKTYSEWRNPPDNPEDVNECLQDPAFYSYYVQDAYGYFSDGYIRSLNIVNGTRIRYHSIKFHEEDEAEAKRYIAHLGPGSVVTLPFQPKAVYVEIFPPSSTPKEIINALLHFSVYQTANQNEDRIIIPVFSSGTKRYTIPLPGGDRYGPSKVTVQDTFPIEPDFAITVHKSLGQTMDRIIIALSHNPASGCNLSHQQIFVALSRVRKRQHIRLLLVGGNEAEKWHSLAYLSSLRQEEHIGFFLAGFRDVHCEHPNINWEGNFWAPTRANAWLEQWLAPRKQKRAFASSDQQQKSQCHQDHNVRRPKKRQKLPSHEVDCDLGNQQARPSKQITRVAATRRTHICNDENTMTTPSRLLPTINHICATDQVFRIHCVEGDGSCLFHTVVKLQTVALPYSSSEGLLLRAQLCRFLSPLHPRFCESYQLALLYSTRSGLPQDDRSVRLFLTDHQKTLGHPNKDAEQFHILLLSIFFPVVITCFINSVPTRDHSSGFIEWNSKTELSALFHNQPQCSRPLLLSLQRPEIIFVYLHNASRPTSDSSGTPLNHYSALELLPKENVPADAPLYFGGDKVECVKSTSDKNNARDNKTPPSPKITAKRQKAPLYYLKTKDGTEYFINYCPNQTSFLDMFETDLCALCPQYKTLGGSFLQHLIGTLNVDHPTYLEHLEMTKRYMAAKKLPADIDDVISFLATVATEIQDGDTLPDIHLLLLLFTICFNINVYCIENVIRRNQIGFIEWQTIDSIRYFFRQETPLPPILCHNDLPTLYVYYHNRFFPTTAEAYHPLNHLSSICKVPPNQRPTGGKIYLGNNMFSVCL